MNKKISEMTAADKGAFLEKTKSAMIHEQGVSWEFMEASIREEIDNTFGGIKFVNMDPDSRK